LGVGSLSWTRFELLRFVRRRRFGLPSGRFNDLRLREYVWGDPDLYGSLFLSRWSHEWEVLRLLDTPSAPE